MFIRTWTIVFKTWIIVLKLGLLFLKLGLLFNRKRTINTQPTVNQSIKTNIYKKNQVNSEKGPNYVSIVFHNLCSQLET